MRGSRTSWRARAVALLVAIAVSALGLVAGVVSAPAAMAAVPETGWTGTFTATWHHHSSSDTSTTTEDMSTTGFVGPDNSGVVTFHRNYLNSGDCFSVSVTADGTSPATDILTVRILEDLNIYGVFSGGVGTFTYHNVVSQCPESNSYDVDGPAYGGGTEDNCADGSVPADQQIPANWDGVTLAGEHHCATATTQQTFTYRLTRDPDRDHDGVPDTIDQCPDEPSTRADGCPDTDADGDGVPDAADQCPDTPHGFPVDAVGCPTLPDADGDGVPDVLDQCPGNAPGDPVNALGCLDTDRDGVGDAIDQCAATPSGMPVNVAGCPDTDGDHVPDNLDQCPDTPPGRLVDTYGCEPVAPIALADTATVVSATPTSIGVLANDHDPQNNIDPATLTITQAPAHGTASVSAGNVIYTSRARFFGRDSFTYQICDTTQLCATAIASVTVVHPGADFRVSIAALNGVVRVGARFTYGVSVTNLGPLPAQGVNLSTQLPPGVREVSVDVGPRTCFVYSCAIGTLAVAETATIRITVDVVNPSSIYGGADAGTASAAATGTTVDPVSRNNTATHRNEFVPDARLVCNRSGLHCKWIFNTYATGQLAAKLIHPANTVALFCGTIGTGLDATIGPEVIALLVTLCGSTSQAAYEAGIGLFQGALQSAADAGNCYTFPANPDGSIPLVQRRLLVVPVPSMFLGGSVHGGSRSCPDSRYDGAPTTASPTLAPLNRFPTRLFDTRNPIGGCHLLLAVGAMSIRRA